jgi:hypothetical protein
MSGAMRAAAAAGAGTSLAPGPDGALVWNHEYRNARASSNSLKQPNVEF